MTCDDQITQELAKRKLWLYPRESELNFSFMITITNKTVRPALVSVLAASALTLTGCSMELPFGGKEEPEETAVTEQPAEETTAASEAPAADTSSAGSASGDYPGAPAGFSPASDGTRLKLGDKADIVLPGYESETPLYFEVTVDKPVEKTVDEVQGNAGGGLTGQEYAGFKCFIATVKYLGAGDNPNAKPTEIFTPPSFRPTSAQGRTANYISGNNDTLCGIHQAERIPSNTKDMQPGKEYKRATITFTEASGGGVEGTGVEMNFGKSGSKYPSGKVYFD